MGKRIILSGRVQGVMCRSYCRQYGKKMGLSGSASNRPDGTVMVLLKSEDEQLTQRYVDALQNNPDNISFYGRITGVAVSSYSGDFSGDYTF